MSRVFVTNEPYNKGGANARLDLTPALAYGELNVLVPAGIPLLDPAPAVEIMEERLENFSDDDYLLPVGDPVMMMLAGTIAFMNNHGRAKVLRWDRVQRKYIVIHAHIEV